ncbi:bifunctional metallophosphatase/5'-nucleotidase [Prevotella sp. A2931]|uniref:Bifunctional metallophosphatase/5'-nucleotidase n=1 Tax=Prevotella illustrans TaxID=2800387 RepID=A0ABS3M5C3_9BACT|nr:bifunctional metallophosphatase/5'-nucleotidase [Prevotella illustrans]PTL27300.1 metallophosphatase [Prevotella sp. oral taxon 820]
MKHLFIFIWLALASVGMAQPKQLVILHTNDTHSTIFPLNINLADTMRAGRGGFMRRVAMLDQERKKEPELLLFDSGDFSQGSPYYTLFKGDVEIGLMNLMRYDAVVIGNHEFDFGLDNMARIFRMAKFPILCANYDFTGTPVEGLVKPYVILKRKGLKIGVFGLSPAMEGLVDTAKCHGVKFLDPIVVAKDMVRTLKQRHCDLIICLSHLGWNVRGIGDNQVIQNTAGLDLVLGGHSHSYFEHLNYVKDPSGKDVPVDQNGKHAIFVGKMKLEMTKR